MRHKAFTVSIPSARLTREADLTGIVSGSRLDKFTACGFTAIRGEYVDAPYINECPLVIELELLHAVNLGAHVQFTGVIKDVKIDSDCLDEAGNPCLTLADPILYDPALRNYHRIGEAVGKAFSIGKELLKE